MAAAIEDHYRPLGPADRVPSDPVAVTLALADKLDTLVGFWAIEEKPTGSSDPYALRRAALGFARTILSNGLRIGLGRAFELACAASLHTQHARSPWFPILERSARAKGDTVSIAALEAGAERELDAFAAAIVKQWGGFGDDGEEEFFGGQRLLAFGDATRAIRADLLVFLADRLKVQLREQGRRHDLVDAVFAPNPKTGVVDDDLVRIVARVEALDAFLRTEEGANLLSNYKRSANILRAEERKEDKLSTVLRSGEYPQSALFQENAEKTLYDALQEVAPAVGAAVAREDFTAAMAALAALRAPVDAFFDQVLVNAEEPKLRYNRLALLTGIRDALHEVADFSKIEG